MSSSANLVKSSSPALTVGIPGAKAAVILAAGCASRLSARTGGGSKARLKLGGLSLLERSVLTLRAAGVERVVVVLGHDADEVEHCLIGLAGEGVQTVRAPEWELGNSASLTAAAPWLADEALFLIVTADHLFSRGALGPILQAEAPATLVDLSPGVAWKDGTRVHVDDGYIVAFSKDLPDSAIDCGAFLVTPAIFRTYAAGAERGDYSVAGMLTEFAKEQRLQAVELPPGEWWCDIDTPDDFERARRRLRRSLSKPSDGPISRAINRPLSTRISMTLVRLHPSPTRLTLMIATIGFLAALLLGAGQGIAGAVLVQLTSVLDGVDGEIARLQFRESRAGHFLDGLLDRLNDTALIAGLGVWAASQGAQVGLLVVLVAAATAAVILSMATKDRVQLMGLRRERDAFGSRLLGGRDGRLLIVAVGSILGQPLATIAAVAVTSGIGLVPRLIYVLRSSAQGPMAIG